MEGSYSLMDVNLYSRDRSFVGAMDFGNVSANATIPTGGPGGSMAMDLSVINFNSEYSFDFSDMSVTVESTSYVGAGVSGGLVPVYDYELNGFNLTYGGGVGFGNNTTIKVRW